MPEDIAHDLVEQLSQDLPVDPSVTEDVETLADAPHDPTPAPSPATEDHSVPMREISMPAGIEAEDTVFADPDPTSLPTPPKGKTTPKPAPPKQPAGVTTPPAGPAAPTGGEEVEEDEFPRELLIASGLTADQARAQFGDAERLRQRIVWEDQQTLQSPMQQPPWQQQQQPQQPWQQQQQPGMQQPPMQPPPQYQGQQQQQEPQQPEPFVYKPFEVKAPADLDPDAVKILEEMASHQATEMGRMTQHFQTSQQPGVTPERLGMMERALVTVLKGEQDRAENAWYDEMDSVIEKLPDQYKAILGEGNRHTIAKGSPEWRARGQVDYAMTNLAKQRQAQQMAPLSQEQLVLRSVMSQFPEAAKQTAEQEAQQAVDTRRQQFTSRPTRRKQAQKTPDQAAADTIGNFLNSKGIPVMPETAEYADGL